MPLFELLVLCMLASKPIDARHRDVAQPASCSRPACALPKPSCDADRQTMIDAFGRAGYARYDESSADPTHRDRPDRPRRVRRRPAQSSPTPPTRTSARRRQAAASGSRASGRPAPTSSFARYRTPGPGCGPTTTSERATRPHELGLPTDPTGAERARRSARTPNSPRHWCGRRSTTTCAPPWPAEPSMTVRIGTSGWSYDHWDDVLYPPRPAGRPNVWPATSRCSTPSNSTRASTAGPRTTPFSGWRAAAT